MFWDHVMSKSPMAKGEFHTVEFFGVIWTKQIDKNNKKKLIFRIHKTKKKKKMEQMFWDHVISKSPMAEGEFHTVEFLWCDLEKADKQKKKRKKEKEREQIHSSLQFPLSPGTKSLCWEKCVQLDMSHSFCRRKQRIIKQW